MSWRYVLPLSLLILGCDSAEDVTCPAGQAVYQGTCLGKPVSVRVSTVGFTREMAKRATYAGPSATFVIRRADDDSAAFPDQPGASGPALAASDSGEPEVHVVDFSGLEEPGEYYVDVEGVGRSAHFRIADDVFAEPFQAAMLGMYGWRCGTAVSFEWQGTLFQHGACHQDDGPAVGGWHDAGDYGKYTNNGAFSLGILFAAWDHFRDKLETVEVPIPERDNGIPDFLDECAYQLGWLLGMQLDDGSVSDRITAANFDGLNVMPEASVAPRKMSPASTKATADFAAVAAHAARIFREFDPELAERAEDGARRAWQFLAEHAEAIPPPASGYTGSYGAGGSPDPDTDDRLWAAAELFETTGDEDALAAFEKASPTLRVEGYWDWDNVSNLGIYTYLDSTRDERDPEVVDRLTSALRGSAKVLAAAADSHPYGRSLSTTYNWGINGTIARTTLTLVVASRLDPDNAQLYLDSASLQLDHLFGRNVYGRSFVTGVGLEPPMNPHHRPSIADGVAPPWPGLLVGGPSNTQDSQTPATTWVDQSSDFTSNEVAINWNAPLIYALAAFLPEP